MGMRSGGGRSYFQTSMPHILQGGGGGGGGVSVAEVMTLTPRCTRSLRSSVIPQNPGGWGQQPHPPLSVRNSLVLGDGGGGRGHHTHNDPLLSFADACLENTSSSSHSIPDGMGMRLVEATCDSNASSEMELNLPTNTDSGIQISHSNNSSHSTIQSASNCGRGTDTLMMGEESEGGDGAPLITVETSFCAN